MAKTPLTEEQKKKLAEFRAQQTATTKPAVAATGTTPAANRYNKAYESIVNTVSDPDVTNAIYTEYLKEVKRIKDPALRAKAQGAPKEKVIANLLQMQKQNYAIKNAGINLEDIKDEWDSGNTRDSQGRSLGKNGMYKKVMTDIGFDPQGMLTDDLDIVIAQAAYNSTLKTSKSEKYANKFTKFKVLTGKGDESYDPDTKFLSAPDSWYGNTTAGQILAYNPEKDADVATTTTDDKTTTTTTEKTQADHLKEPVKAPTGSPWWLQDIIKTAHAAGNLMRIKKYMPWQATPGVFTPRVSFLDPTRQLAASAEQANIQTQALAQFTGPQALSARSSSVQGQGFKQAADTIGQVHNQNVQISNQQDAQNAQIMNNASQQRAGLATSLWDKYQTVNQQFDNAKSQARDALVNQYTNAITNKAYTANLNKMYPQYAVNPAGGGEMYFRDPRAQKPDYSKDKDFTTIYNNLMEQNPTLKADPKTAADIAIKMMGIQTAPENPFLQRYGQQPQGNIPQVGYQNQEQDQTDYSEEG